MTLELKLLCFLGDFNGISQALPLFSKNGLGIPFHTLQFDLQIHFC